MSRFQSLGDYLDEWASGSSDRQATAATIVALATASMQISALVAQGSLAGDPGATQGVNQGGDTQKLLDILANERVIESLRNAPVAQLISEELDYPITITSGAPLNAAVDPLDGSSNIDTNLSMGTIFSVWPVSKDLLAPGNRQCAAGYVIYGPQTALVVTLGDGTLIFTLDRESGEFRLTCARVQIPETTREFAINVSNFHHWDKHIRAYIDDCLACENGPRENNYNMRWVASLVAECHRILSRGGIFLYPGDTRPGYAHGRLRLVYELNPIAWLVEQAGGSASTGSERILDLEPADPHQRAPLIFGSAREVARVDRYYAELHPLGERSPLFNKRGLLRT